MTSNQSYNDYPSSERAAEVIGSVLDILRVRNSLSMQT